MKRSFAIISLSILISACGADIAYKRGATDRDYQASKASCTDAKTESALKACLEEKGWAVQKLDNIGLSDEELFATASYDDDNRPSKSKPLFETTEDIASDSTTETVEQAEAAKTPEPVVTAKAAPAAEEEPAVKKPYYQTLPGPAKSSKSAPSKPTTTANVKPKPKPNMMDTYVIKSWWKMGGNLTMLEGHMDECSADLGEAHFPDKKTFTFTRGFAICMRNHGWRGLVEKRG